MSDINNKTLEAFKDIEDLKEYSNAQYKTIIAQSKKINDLERKLESTEEKLAKSEQTNTIAGSLSKDQDNNGSDGETICLIQLALLRSAAMKGELTLEETKKVEIYVKTLQVLRGKGGEDKKPKEAGKALSNEELIALMNSVEV